MVLKSANPEGEVPASFGEEMQYKNISFLGPSSAIFPPLAGKDVLEMLSKINVEFPFTLSKIHTSTNWKKILWPNWK